MFTKRQKIFIALASVAIVIVMFLVLEFMKALLMTNFINPPHAVTYQVMHYDQDGYYIAVQVKDTPDGYVIPDEYYEEDDRIVVYKPQNVQGSLPAVGDYVNIALDLNGENPLVERR